MQTLTIEKNNAIKAYQQTDSTGKTLLENLFGRPTFLPVTDRIKTVEDACKELGICIPVSPYDKLCAVIKAINEGWVPDWKNKNQYKWHVYLNMTASAVSLDLVSFDYGGSDVPSRLCLRSEELGKYLVSQFNDLVTQVFFEI